MFKEWDSEMESFPECALFNTGILVEKESLVSRFNYY
jgi:hypothetical protein